jgi:sulfur-carrier protein
VSESVRVTVKLFGAYRDAVNSEQLERELPAGTDLAGLWTALGAECPALAELDPVRLSSVNLDFATDDRQLADGDEVAFFPPVSGG